LTPEEEDYVQDLLGSILKDRILEPKEADQLKEFAEQHEVPS